MAASPVPPMIDSAVAIMLEMAMTTTSTAYHGKEDGGRVTLSWDLDDFNVTNTTSGVNGTAELPAELSVPIILLKALPLSFVVLFTVFGNILVLLAIFINANLRTITTNYFIANLAVADCLLGITVLPFSATLEIVDRWLFGAIFCDVWAAVDVLCCTASILSLCVISVDRYVGVTRPLQHSIIMSERRAAFVIALVWLVSGIISVVPFFGWEADTPMPDPYKCEVTKQLGYVMFSVSCSFYVPLLIILIVYYRVYREALSQSRCLASGTKTARSSSANSSHEITLRIHRGTARPMTASSQRLLRSTTGCGHSQLTADDLSTTSNCGSGSTSQHLTLSGKIAKFKREKKAAKTLGIVVGVFIVCWFPFFFLLPLEALCTTCHIPPMLFKVIFWLGYCNSLMNPIIYACSSREFKRAFSRIMRCQWRRRRRPQSRSFLCELAERNRHVTNISEHFSSAMRRFHAQQSSSAATGQGEEAAVAEATGAACRLETSTPVNNQTLADHKAHSRTPSATPSLMINLRQCANETALSPDKDATDAASVIGLGRTNSKRCSCSDNNICKELRQKCCINLESEPVMNGGGQCDVTVMIATGRKHIASPAVTTDCGEWDATGINKVGEGQNLNSVNDCELQRRHNLSPLPISSTSDFSSSNHRQEHHHSRPQSLMSVDLFIEDDDPAEENRDVDSQQPKTPSYFTYQHDEDKLVWL